MTKETTNSISTYLYKGELHRAYYSYSNSCLKDLDMFTDCLELNLTQNRVDRHVEPRHSVTLFSFPTVAERTSVEETTKLNVQIKNTGKKYTRLFAYQSQTQCSKLSTRKHRRQGGFWWISDVLLIELRTRVINIQLYSGCLLVLTASTNWFSASSGTRKRRSLFGKCL